MTIGDCHVVMKRNVGIAELKSRLSEYLRHVRCGETIAVLDRETPIARLEPVAGVGLGNGGPVKARLTCLDPR